MAEVHPAPSVGVKSPAKFERHFECVVCGFPFPASELSYDHWKRLVCIDCTDEPGNKDFEKEDAPASINTKPPWPGN